MTTCTFWLVNAYIYILHYYTPVHKSASDSFLLFERERGAEKNKNCYCKWMKCAINASNEVVVWAINHFINYNSFILLRWGFILFYRFFYCSVDILLYFFCCCWYLLNYNYIVFFWFIFYRKTKNKNYFFDFFSFVLSLIIVGFAGDETE